MADRKPLMAGNWKMHKTVDEAVDAARNLADRVSDASGVEIMIAPSFTALAPMADALRNTQIGLGGQNLFWEDEGAYTGEVSGPMLKSAGCRYVIIGHSERRQYFGETEETVNKRLKAALRHGLVPVLCVGETESEREAEKTFSVLDKQVGDGLKEFVADDLKTLVLAYEPVWAIGTGKTATADQAQEAHKFLRALIEKKYGKDLAESIRILYGGSVKPGNAAELMGMPDLDGALVGGASLEAASFSEIVLYDRNP
jgi:triosephosphate isomerase (TIM)